MASVGYARVSSTGQQLDVQIGKLAMCERVFKKKQSAVDADRAELRRCLDYVREGDTLVVTKIDRLARSTTDLYRIVSTLTDKGVAFKVVDDPSIDTTSRTGKLVMGVGRKRELTYDRIEDIKKLRLQGSTVPEIMRSTRLSKASVYRALRQG
jgi:DNA invertase Pin-like site-specific DNA recombinase